MFYKSHGKFLLIALGLLLFMSGCGNAKNDASKPSVSISVWHWMTDREPALQELAKKYVAQTGVKIDFELFAPSEAYSQKIRAAAQGKNLPDIFGVLGEKKTLSSFIKAGHVLNLTSYMAENNNAWKNTFFTEALAVNDYAQGNSYGIEPGIYGVPIDIMTIQMLYNKTLLKELTGSGNPPTKFEDFIALGPKLKEKNMQGLVSGWGEGWMIDCLTNNYAFNIMGKDKVLKTYKGEVSYTDSDWVKVFSLFKQMKDTGVLATGVVTMVNKTAEQLFASGKAVFAFNGSWCVNVYKGMNPNLNYGVMLPPAATDKAMSIWGGAGSSFMINAGSKNKQEAVKFLKWLTEKQQQESLSTVTSNLPANKNSLAQLPAILAEFSRNMGLSTHPNAWDVSEFTSVTENLDRGVQSIIIGEKTPEQVAVEVQRVKERELVKKMIN